MVMRSRSVLLVAVLLVPLACGRYSARFPTPEFVDHPLVALAPRHEIPVGTVQGFVRANDQSYAVRGAHVVVDDGRYEVIVDSVHRFEVRGLAPGLHHLSVRRLQFRPTAGTIEVPPGAGAAVDITLEVVTVCLDDCAPEQPRTYGEIRNAQ